jgi:hypothetical protein
MKFFHYTQSRRLESIMEEGLKPAVDEDESNYSSFDFWDAGMPDSVVWLTAEPINPHGGGNVVADVRITLELSRSRRLRRWVPWLKEHLPERFAEIEPSDWSVWIYKGTISPDKFTAIEFDCLD